MDARTPLLIYDGDCGFCGYWARYWQKLTGDRVRYQPYQEVAAQYPEIPLACAGAGRGSRGCWR